MRRFVEKPSKEEAARLGTANINAGIYVLEPEILSMIAPGVVTSFEYDVFPHLLVEGLPFFGYVMSGNYWRDIVSPQSYLAAHLDFLSGVIKLAESPVRLKDGGTDLTIGTNAVISKDCVVSEGGACSELSSGSADSSGAIRRDRELCGLVKFYDFRER